MAPKSKAENKAPESTASRRSARIAGSAAPESAVQEPKKRAASAPKSEQTAKKAKTASAKADKKAPTTIAEEEREEEKKEEEKKAEAPKSAKADTGSSKVLKVGDGLPSLVLLNEKGEDVDVASLTKDGKGVVVFLYPKADTPGCTTQACGYRDHFDEIKTLGYDIYGLSKDKPAAQQKWITKKSLTYPLLSDPESKFIKKLGAFVQPNNTKRSHFIFSKDDGKLIDAALGVKPADDPSNVIKFLKNHHK